MRTAMIGIMAITLTALSLNTGMAATLKCEVSKVEGTTITLNCGQEAEKLKAGVEVKIRTEKATQAIEGC